MADKRDMTEQHAMILQSSTKPKPACWTALPSEIQLLILEAVIQQKHPGWSSSAAVCKEWQFVIERENFQQLKLHVLCLDDFERITLRRQHLVRHISLDIELQCYTCLTCSHFEFESDRRENSSTVSHGIWKLFSILSGWTTTEQKGLTLELSAYSPSDINHWFKHYRFASGRGGDDEDYLVGGRDVGTLLLDDPKHGWKKGHQETPPPKDAVTRLFSTISLRFPDELPRVDAVTRLTIRRQLRRRIEPATLRFILEKLDRLEHMVYEPWRACCRLGNKMLDQRTYLPTNLSLPTAY